MPLLEVQAPRAFCSSGVKAVATVPRAAARCRRPAAATTGMASRHASAFNIAVGSSQPTSPQLSKLNWRNPTVLLSQASTAAGGASTAGWRATSAQPGTTYLAGCHPLQRSCHASALPRTCVSRRRRRPPLLLAAARLGSRQLPARPRQRLSRNGRGTGSGAGAHARHAAANGMAAGGERKGGQLPATAAPPCTAPGGQPATAPAQAGTSPLRCCRQPASPCLILSSQLKPSLAPAGGPGSHQRGHLLC